MGTFTEELSFEVIWKPFFLNPTLSKAVPLVQHLSNLYGADAAASIVKPTSRLSRDGAEVVSTSVALSFLFLVAVISSSRNV